jgi:hypothetical protein
MEASSAGSLLLYSSALACGEEMVTIPKTVGLWGLWGA